MAKLDPWIAESLIDKSERDKALKNHPTVVAIAIFIIVISTARIALIIISYLNAEHVQHLQNITIIGIIFECFLIYIAVSLINGKNWARLTWLWLMFFVFLLINHYEQTYGPMRLSPTNRVLNDLTFLAWIVSLYFLNVRVVKNYFRRYELNAKELAEAISLQEKFAYREKNPDKNKFTRIELQHQLGREPTDAEVKAADKDRWMQGQ